MSSHGQQQWYDMEQFDLEEALRLFCETTTRSFLWGMWNEHQRSKILEQKVAEQRQTISELMESEGALDALANEQASRIERIERELELSEAEIDNHWYKREEELEERIHVLETAYDEVDREYKATLGALEFEQGLACEQAETIRQLEDVLADRDEDVRKLKMRIAQLEEDKERLRRRRDANSPHRGVGQ